MPGGACCGWRQVVDDDRAGHRGGSSGVIGEHRARPGVAETIQAISSGERRGLIGARMAPRAVTASRAATKPGVVPARRATTSPAPTPVRRDDRRCRRRGARPRRRRGSCGTKAPRGRRAAGRGEGRPRTPPEASGTQRHCRPLASLARAPSERGEIVALAGGAAVRLIDQAQHGRHQGLIEDAVGIGGGGAGGGEVELAALDHRQVAGVGEPHRHAVLNDTPAAGPRRCGSGRRRRVRRSNRARRCERRPRCRPLLGRPGRGPRRQRRRLDPGDGQPLVAAAVAAGAAAHVGARGGRRHA